MPPKRPRPDFSPPLPNKSKTKSTTTTTTTKKAPSTSNTTNKKRSRPSTTKESTTTKPTTKKRRQRTPSPHNSSAPSSPSSTHSDTHTNDDAPENVVSDDNEDENDEDAEMADADMLLVEITHDPSHSHSRSKDGSEMDNGKPAIPEALVHRIIAEGWVGGDTGSDDGGKKGQQMKMSTDARRVLARYVETFVREAVARCALSGGGGGHDEDEAGGKKEWVDVEDLERVGAQLVLDF